MSAEEEEDEDAAREKFQAVMVRLFGPSCSQWKDDTAEPLLETRYMHGPTFTKDIRPGILCYTSTYKSRYYVLAGEITLGCWGYIMPLKKSSILFDEMSHLFDFQLKHWSSFYCFEPIIMREKFNLVSHTWNLKLTRISFEEE